MSGWVVLVPFGFVVVLPGVVVVVLVLPGTVFALPGVVVLPDVVSVLDPVVLEPVLELPVDEPTEPELLEPGVPIVVLVPMPVLVSVVPLEGFVVVSLPVVVDERGLVVELPLRGGVGAERPSGERLGELDVSLLVPMLPDEEVPTPGSVVVDEPVVPLPVVSWVLPIVPELAPGVPTVELLEPLVLGSVPAAVPVPVPVVPADGLPCALPDVLAPADPLEPPEPPLWLKAAAATTIAPAARNVAIFS